MAVSEIIILSLGNLGCYVFIHCVVVLFKMHNEEKKLTYLKAENAALRLKIDRLEIENFNFIKHQAMIESNELKRMYRAMSNKELGK